MTVTATGSNFVQGAEMAWNGAARATLYQSPTSLQMSLTQADLATAGTFQVSVTNPQSAGGGASNSLPFTVSGDLTPNPIPVLTSINPSSANAGAAALTITLTGSNFTRSSAVTWNSQTLTSALQSSTTLTAQVPASDLVTAGTVRVTVVNPAPSGGTSGTVNFVINAVGTAAQTVISTPANDLAWDPVNQKIYLSIPSFVGSNGNTVQALDPVTGQLGASTFAGSEPNLLSVSSSSKYLYVSQNGASTVQRFVLPALTPDITIPLGADSFDGPYTAMDVQASPASDGAVAVVRGTLYVSPAEEGGVVIYDDGVARPNALCGFIQSGCAGGGGGRLYNSIQWNVDATEMFAANNEDTGFDFYTVPVTSSGFGAVHDYGGAAGGFGEGIHFDTTTKLVYDDNGSIIDPTTGSKVGTFNASGLCVPDGKLGVVFFLGQNLSSAGGTYTVQWFDINHYTPVGSMTIQNVVGSPLHLIRWGTNGLAFTAQNSAYNGSTTTTTGAVYLLTGSFNNSPSSNLRPSAFPDGNVHQAK